MLFSPMRFFGDSLETIKVLRGCHGKKCRSARESTFFTASAELQILTCLPLAHHLLKGRQLALDQRLLQGSAVSVRDFLCIERNSGLLTQERTEILVRTGKCLSD